MRKRKTKSKYDEKHVHYTPDDRDPKCGVQARHRTNLRQFVTCPKCLARE